MRGSPPARARPRRFLVAALAAMLAFAVPAAALADNALKKAKHELQQTRDRIHERKTKMEELQRRMNRLATRISRSESRIARSQAAEQKLKERIRVYEAEARALKAKLDTRVREAYILGPGTPVMYLLTATSTQDVVSRIGFLDEMNRRDQVLALQVQDAQLTLKRAQGELVRVQNLQRIIIARLEAANRRLRRLLARSQQLFAQLQAHRDAVLAEISKIRPFAVCPVDGPVAVADDFGIWVNHGKKWGGRHQHQGNDMMAEMGTPIVAPFAGTAVVATNQIGGQAVKVYGQFGYVYNAHLSAFGKLGPVKPGDVIGYVGATGDAGGPHDHFEWHPAGGPAVDPHGFLMLVC